MRLEEGAGLFVLGVVSFALLDDAGAELADGERVGGTGDHDLKHVEVLA